MIYAILDILIYIFAVIGLLFMIATIIATKILIDQEKDQQFLSRVESESEINKHYEGKE